MLWYYDIVPNLHVNIHVPADGGNCVSAQSKLQIKSDNITLLVPGFLILSMM